MACQPLETRDECPEDLLNSRTVSLTDLLRLALAFYFSIITVR